MYKTFLLLLFILPAHSQMQVTISTCQSANTCISTYGEKIRLACIDVPDSQWGSKLEQFQASLAKDFLTNNIKGRTVQIRRISMDRMGRTLAELNHNGISLQRSLISKGLATPSTSNLSQCKWLTNLTD